MKDRRLIALQRARAPLERLRRRSGSQKQRRTIRGRLKRRLEQLTSDAQGQVALQLTAARSQAAHRLVAPRLGQHRCLADPRRTRKHHHRAAALPSRRDRAGDEVKLRLPLEHRHDLHARAPGSGMQKMGVDRRCEPGAAGWTVRAMPTQSVIGAVDLAACRRFSAALAACDVAAALADAHPEIELHRPCDVLRGAAGVRTLAAGPRLIDLTASVHLEDVVADGGGCAVAHGRLELRRTDTGELTETLPVAALLEARDGQVVRWQAVPPVHPS